MVVYKQQQQYDNDIVVMTQAHAHTHTHTHTLMRAAFTEISDRGTQSINDNQSMVVWRTWISRVWFGTVIILNKIQVIFARINHQMILL